MRFITIGLASLLFAAHAQTMAAPSKPNCDGMLNKRITASGTIINVVELEMFIDAISFRDTKTGCLMTAIEALLDTACEPGKAIVMTGTLTKSELVDGYEIDRGENPPADTLVCR